MSRPRQKSIFGMTYLQIGIISGLGMLTFGLIGCVAILMMSGGLSSSTSRATEIPLPPHMVSDYWDNGKGNNFAYFIVADKSLPEEEAKELIAYYQNKHPGFKLINIWIFCDATYANQKTIDDLSVTDDQFFSHVIYWYQTGEWSGEGLLFQTDADDAYPTFRSACK